MQGDDDDRAVARLDEPLGVGLQLRPWLVRLRIPRANALVAAVDHRSEERAQGRAHLDLRIEHLQERVDVPLVPLVKHLRDQLGIRPSHDLLLTNGHPSIARPSRPSLSEGEVCRVKRTSATARDAPHRDAFAHGAGTSRHTAGR